MGTYMVQGPKKQATKGEPGRFGSLDDVALVFSGSR